MLYRRFCFLLFFILLHTFVYSVPTRLVIRAKARDAKFIGTSIGGAYVKVTEVLTGKLLASGYTTGSTGSTDILMKQPHTRFGALTNDNTAAYHAMIDIEHPVFIEVEVVAPVNQRQASARVTTQLWMIPGKHIEDDGLILEIPGMIVNVLAPQTHETISLASLKNGFLTVRANVVMMCGCPLSEGGLWDTEDLEVKALISTGEELIASVPMLITSKLNTFEGKIPLKSDGMYEVIIYAYNAKTGNTGVDKVNVVIGE